MTETTVLHGERLDVLERVVVAPAAGVFRPLPPDVITTEGEIVHRGQTIAVVDGPNGTVPVESAFTGFLMGVFAVAGERVREGEPVAWLRTTETA
jgi:biotin carboxyl carrier protein